MRCHYSVLGVRPLAPESEIRSAYKAKALKLHPDKNPSGDDRAFKELQSAVEVLLDSRKRAEYDREQEAKREAALPRYTYGAPSDDVYQGRRAGGQQGPPARPPVSVDEIRRKDQELRKAAGGKSLKDLLKEQESMKRDVEEQRHMKSEKGNEQRNAIERMRLKIEELKLPGLVWKREFGQFTEEEEAERRQIVSQQLAERDEEWDEVLLYQAFVSASNIIIGRRPQY